MLEWYNMKPIMQHRPTFEKEEAGSYIQIYVRR